MSAAAARPRPADGKVAAVTIALYVGPEAAAAAEMLDREIEKLLTEAGLPRINPTGETRRVLGRIVQWAIDERMKRVDA